MPQIAIIADADTKIFTCAYNPKITGIIIIEVAPIVPIVSMAVAIEPIAVSEVIEEIYFPGLGWPALQFGPSICRDKKINEITPRANSPPGNICQQKSPRLKDVSGRGLFLCVLNYTNPSWEKIASSMLCFVFTASINCASSALYCSVIFFRASTMNIMVNPQPRPRRYVALNY